MSAPSAVPEFSVLARRPSERLAIVEYILATPNLQETDYLEWKIGYDLSTRPGAASTAKQLIGMANRDAIRAERHAEGYAYVLLGVEPGDLGGVEQWDSANIENWLSPFIGPDLRYDAHYVSKDDREVLFLTVDPPRQGDPIYCFQAASEDLSTRKTIPEAAIFVRHGSTTAPPTADDITRLTNRGAASSATDAEIRDLRLELDASAIAVISASMFTQERRTLWGRAYRRGMLAKLPNRASDPHGIFSISMAGMGERRSPDTFTAEVLNYIGAITEPEMWTRMIVNEAVKKERSVLRLNINNDSPENYENTVVEITFFSIGRANIFVRASEALRVLGLPDPPDEWGRSLIASPILASTPVITSTRSSHPEIEGRGSGEVLVRYPEFRVRPHTQHALPALILTLPPHFAGMTIPIRWRATSSNTKSEFADDLELKLPGDAPGQPQDTSDEAGS
jgi:hypothetical protein